MLQRQKANRNLMTRSVAPPRMYCVQKRRNLPPSIGFSITPYRPLPTPRAIDVRPAPVLAKMPRFSRLAASRAAVRVSPP